MCKTKRVTAIVLAVAFLMLTFSSCSTKKIMGNDEIISQRKRQEGKTQITILVKHAFSINAFEKAAEEKFPEIDIIQVGNYTSDRGLVEYERRLKNDDLTDIVMTWPLDVGNEYWDDRLLDLSGLPLTGNYHISMLNSISENGRLYYLPGPAQVRGIVYNKTLFKENGWEVPKDLEGFISLCKEIEKSGIRPIQIGFKNPEVLDTAFVGYSYGDCFSKPQDAEWMQSYNNKKGSFGDQYGTGLDTFQRMIDEGIWKKGDLDIDYPQRETMLFTRKCAMTEDSVLMARMGYQLTGSTDEFALMPFFSPNSNTDWARLYMVCYIGVNKHLAEPANKEKYELAMKLLEYISTPEGQAALSADTGAMYSSVRDVPPPDIAEIEDLIPALNDGRYAIFPELKNAQGALREGLAGMVAGTMDKNDVISLVDEQNINSAEDLQAEVIGKASEDFSLIETGNFVTDVMRERAGTELSLFLDNGKDGRYNGKGIRAKLYQGDQTPADIACVLPGLKYGEKGALLKITMTGEDLISTLEHAIPVNNNETGWFYYFSGLKMSYSVTDEPGSRIKEISDEKGKPIDPQKLYSIAVMDETVPEEYIKSSEDTGVLISQVLIDEIKDKGEISPDKNNRFVVVE